MSHLPSHNACAIPRLFRYWTTQINLTDNTPTHSRPILLVIDVEPDARNEQLLETGWEASSLALDHLSRLRGELEEATGSDVRFNWFLRCDPQVERTWGRADFVAEGCPDIIRTIERTGDHCGIHVHLWRWSVDRHAWFNDFDDPAWANECVDTSVAAYRSIFASAPVSTRFGDRWMSNDCVNALRRTGIMYDITVEPDLPDVPVHDDRNATRRLPDFRGAPREPWTPSAGNFLVPGNRAHANDLWMLPATTSKRAWRLVRRAPYLMHVAGSPNLALDSAKVWGGISRALDKPGHTPIVIVFRSGDLANPRFLKNFLHTTQQLVRHPALPFCQFTDPADAVTRWLASR
jgi:hypothetical protein